MNRVTEKIHEKYEGVVVNTTSKKELMIQVKENEEYFNSVKKDMESIAKSVIKSSALKDYTVVVERLDLSIVTEDVEKIHKELLHLTSTLMEGLKNYDVIGDIEIELSKIHYLSNINEWFR